MIELYQDSTYLLASCLIIYTSFITKLQPIDPNPPCTLSHVRIRRAQSKTTTFGIMLTNWSPVRLSVLQGYQELNPLTRVSYTRLPGTEPIDTSVLPGYRESNPSRKRNHSIVA